jgi:hypothetical protein
LVELKPQTDQRRPSLAEVAAAADFLELAGC